MKKILATVGGGMGNRFFGLLTAYYFAHRTNSILNIYWPRDAGCYAGWGDLFEINSDKINVCDVDPSLVKLSGNEIWLTHDEGIHQLMKNDQNSCDRSMPVFLTRLTAGSLWPAHGPDSHNLGLTIGTKEKSSDEVLDIINSAEEDKTIIITDCYPTVLADSWSPNYDPIKVVEDLFQNVFVIKKDILRRAEEFCKKNNINKQSTVGYHFRTINLHPIDLGHASYVIENAISSGAENIFLCADNKEAENVLRECWPNHVISYAKEEYIKKQDEKSPWFVEGKFLGGYNMEISKQAVIDALVDCVILSKTNSRSMLLDTGWTWEGSFYQMSRLLQRFGNL